MPEVIDQFLEIGDYSGDCRGSGTFTYTDMENRGGDMRLMAVSNSDAGWDTPVCISKSDGAIVSQDIIKLPAGDNYLAVWTEIAGEDVGKTCPPSVIKYAVSEMVYGNWSWFNPQTVVNLGEVATHLELLPNGEQVSLVYLSTDEGPLGVTYQVSGLTWSGTAWSQATQLVERSEISGFAVCGTDDPAASPLRLAYVNKDRELAVLNWNSEGVSGETVLEEQAGNDLALAGNSDGEAFLAWSGYEQGIGLYSCPDGEWIDQGIPYAGASPNELALQLLPEDRLEIVWTEENSEIVLAGVLGQDGTVINPACAVTAEDSGKYYDAEIIEVVDNDSGTANLYLFVLNEDDDLDLNAYPLDANANRPLLEGTVSISGTPKVGETLTADTGGLTNQFGALSFQWKRDGTVIEDAAAANYVPAAEDIGYTITVTVTSSGNSGSVTSAATAVVTDVDGSVSYTVTFNSQGGSEVSSVRAESGTTINAPENPAREGYIFRGWFMDSGCTQAWNFTTDTVTENITLYAKWNTEQADECFIATAAYGSKFTWSVTLLRSFRDQYLLSSKLGRALVDFYYQNSPPLADYIAGKEGLKLLVRILLTPVVVLVYLVIHPLPAGALLFLLITVWCRRKHKYSASGNN